MEEVPQLVELESKECGLHIVLLLDQMAQLLFILDTLMLGFFVFLLLLIGIILPYFNG